MERASEEMRFELAAKYRDLRKTVLAVSEQQKMAVSPDRDVDIFGYYREGARLALQLFTMREGKIVGRREFFWEDLRGDDRSTRRRSSARSPDAVLLDRLRAARDSRPRRLRRPRAFGEGSDGAQAGGASASSTRSAGEARDDRARREERADRVRATLPRPEARHGARARRVAGDSWSCRASRRASSRSTSRTSRARRTSRRWSSARTAR